MAEYICTNCGYEGQGRTHMRGSRTMEIVIWTTLMVPGPFYSMYRRMGLKRECNNCHMHAMVRPGSKEGKLMQRRIDIELGVIKPPVVVKTEEIKKEVPAVGFGGGQVVEKVNKKPVNPEEW